MAVSIVYVSKIKENLKSSTDDDKEESREPGYDEDRDQPEEAQEDRRINSTTAATIIQDTIICSK